MFKMAVYAGHLGYSDVIVLKDLNLLNRLKVLTKLIHLAKRLERKSQISFAAVASPFKHIRTYRMS